VEAQCPRLTCSAHYLDARSAAIHSSHRNRARPATAEFTRSNRLPQRFSRLGIGYCCVCLHRRRPTQCPNRLRGGKRRWWHRW